jgi:transposase
MRPKGSAEELFHHRQRAIELLAQGLPKSEVARRIGVTRRTVRRWHHQWRHGGEAALRPKPACGAPAKLTPAQQAELTQALLAGAKTAGFDNELWTGRRIAALIKQRFGVVYHERSVLRLLRALGFTPQRPEKVAHERKPGVKARWLHWQWPAIKKNHPPPGRLAGFSG